MTTKGHEMKQLTDEVRDAIRIAFNLGQTYWRQADSESVKQQNKSITREDVIRMAKESGFKACVGTTDKEGNYHPFVNALGKDIPIEWLERFAALAALDTAQQEPVNAMLMEALERMVESVTGVDQVSAVDEARAALTAAKQAQPEPSDDYLGKAYRLAKELFDHLAVAPAQPERAPLSDEEIEQAVKTHGVSWTGYREDKHGFYTIPILLPYHYLFARAIEAAIKQGGQHD